MAGAAEVICATFEFVDTEVVPDVFATTVGSHNIIKVMMLIEIDADIEFSIMAKFSLFNFKIFMLK